MDDYTLQQELEALAGNAYNFDTLDATEPIATTTSRWQKLFNLTPDEAVEALMAHRNNLTRTRISDAHWDAIQVEQEAQGYDREAYEYELDVQRKKAVLPSLLPTAAASGTAERELTYLVEMNGPLSSVDKVRLAAGMEQLPHVVHGRSLEDGRRVSLCCIDEAAKKALLQWVGSEGKGFEPTILVNPKSLR